MLTLASELEQWRKDAPGDASFAPNAEDGNETNTGGESSDEEAGDNNSMQQDGADLEKSYLRA